MARVQQADVMGNVQFDPGIAQSVLTNKEMQSRERTAMAQMDTQKKIAQGDQATSAGNAQQAAFASMANTQAGIAGESNMQSQRLAAQSMAQDKQMENEKWMKMKDEQFTQGLEADRANLEIQLQKGMQVYQTKEGAEKRKFGMELMKYSQAWDTKMAMMKTKMYFSTLKALGAQGMTAKDAMAIQDQMVESGKSLTRDMDTVGQGVESVLRPEGQTLKNALERAYTTENGAEIMEADNRVVDGRTREIIGEVLKSVPLGSSKWSVDDFLSGSQAVTSKVLGMIKEGKTPTVDVARLLKAAKTIEETIGETKNPILNRVVDGAISLQLGIAAAGMGDDKTAKDFVQAARNQAEGKMPNMSIYDMTQKQVPLLEQDSFFDNMMIEEGLSYKGNTELGQMYGELDRNWTSQWNQMLQGLGWQMGSEQMGPPAPQGMR
jgi:hypothetical protein